MLRIASPHTLRAISRVTLRTGIYVLRSNVWQSFGLSRRKHTCRLARSGLMSLYSQSHPECRYAPRCLRPQNVLKPHHSSLSVLIVVHSLQIWLSLSVGFSVPTSSSGHIIGGCQPSTGNCRKVLFLLGWMWKVHGVDKRWGGRIVYNKRLWKHYGRLYFIYFADNWTPGVNSKTNEWEGGRVHEFQEFIRA